MFSVSILEKAISFGGMLADAKEHMNSISAK